MTPPPDSLEFTPEGTPSPAPVDTGESLGAFGKYELVKRLASGGMAEIFLARLVSSHGFEKKLVIKRILPHLAGDPKFLRMFVDEARIAAHLQHRNIVQVFDFGEVDGHYFLAMEYVKGLDAWRLLRRINRTESRVPVELCIHITREMLQGLDCVHRAKDADGIPLSIVHRDVSPSNVYISDTGEVKLGDFGIARARLSAEGTTEPATLKGKYGYMSPEQILGRPFDHRADLFAAGVVLSELLLGKALFSGSSKLSVLLAVRDVKIDALRERASELPDGLFEVILRALARDPDARYVSAKDFSDALVCVLQVNEVEPTATALAEIVNLAIHGPPRRGETPRTTRGGVHDRPTVEAPTPLNTDQLTPVVGQIANAINALAALSTDEATTLYVLRDGERRMGPMKFAQLVELLTTGDLSPQAIVSRNGGAEKLITEEPDLARHLPYRSIGEPPPKRVDRLEGSFERTSTVNLLCRFATTRDTGLLTATSGPVKKEIYFLEGRPENVMSNLAGEMLGEFLVSRKIITRGELEMALAMLPRFNGKLGDTLTTLGLIEPVALLRHIIDQVKTKLLDMFRWRKGTFGFERGLLPPTGGFPLGIDPFELIVEGVDFGYPNREIEALIAPLFGRRIRPAAAYGPGLYMLPLRPAWIRVLETVSRPQTISHALERADVGDSAEGMRALLLGFEAGLIEFESGIAWSPVAAYDKVEKEDR